MAEIDTSNPRRRPLKPLPKRQRLTVQSQIEAGAVPAQAQAQLAASGGGQQPSFAPLSAPSYDEQSHSVDEDNIHDRQRTAAQPLPTRENRPSIHQEDNAHPPLHTRPPSSHPSLSLNTNHDPDGASETSSASAARYPDADQDQPDQPTLAGRPHQLPNSNYSVEGGPLPPTSPSIDTTPTTPPKSPSYFPLFGQAGDELVRALANASAFSRAGLFGGLGLAALHPSLAPPGNGLDDDEEEYGGSEAAEYGDGDEYGDADENGSDSDGGPSRRRGGFRKATYTRTAPGIEPSSSLGGAGSYGDLSSGLDGVATGGVVVAMNNKKKRKIPGVGISRTGDIEDERAFDDEPLDGTPSQTQLRNAIISQPLVGTTGLFGVSKVPPNLPTTAAAALAKLIPRRPHISLHPFTSSFRHHQNSLNRTQPPVPLPSPVVYIPPPKSAAGLAPPPPLPPGSGLKGSKALKAAKKFEKDREKENVRIKALLEGENGIKLKHFWHEGRPSVPKPLPPVKKTSASKSSSTKGAASAYPTPPPSSDEGDDVVGMSLDEFAFDHPPSSVIKVRWVALVDQIVRFKEAKERAEKARIEEAERKKEKEREEEEDMKRAMAAGKNKPVGNTGPPNVGGKGKKTASSSNSAGKRSQHDHPNPPQPPGNNNNDTNPSPHPNVEPLTDRSLNTASSAPPPPPPPPLPPTASVPPLLLKKGGTKKKKRSAHANALNSHHRDNYVPSRMPTSSSARDSHHDANSLENGLLSWPPSEEALAAAGGSVGSRMIGSDEWMCANCEFALWFGTEAQMGKVVRNRKKVLKVRRKARERAAKAANAGGTD